MKYKYQWWKWYEPIRHVQSNESENYPKKPQSYMTYSIIRYILTVWVKSQVYSVTHIAITYGSTSYGAVASVITLLHAVPNCLISLFPGEFQHREWQLVRHNIKQGKLRLLKMQLELALLATVVINGRSTVMLSFIWTEISWWIKICHENQFDNIWWCVFVLLGPSELTLVQQLPITRLALDFRHFAIGEYWLSLAKYIQGAFANLADVLFPCHSNYTIQIVKIHSWLNLAEKICKILVNLAKRNPCLTLPRIIYSWSWNITWAMDGPAPRIISGHDDV